MTRDKMTCKAYFESFNPPSITVQCDCDGDSHVGKLSVQIRNVEINVMDLSMGGIIPGNPRIGSKANMQIAEIEFSEPVELGKIKGFLAKTSREFSQLEKAVREELLKKPLLK